MSVASYSRSDLDLSKVDWTKLDATTDEEIGRRAAENADTAPVFSRQEILAAGRRIVPDAAEDVRILRTRLGLSQKAFAARLAFRLRLSANMKAIDTPQPTRHALCWWAIAREPDAVIRVPASGT